MQLVISVWPSNLVGLAIWLAQQYGISSFFRSHISFFLAEAGTEIPLKCLAGQIVDTGGKLYLTTTKMNCRTGLQWFVCRKGTFQSYLKDNDFCFIKKTYDTYI